MTAAPPKRPPPTSAVFMEFICCNIERRGDGALLVSVQSRTQSGNPLPDAVFAFRAGDPQFKYWEARYEERCLDERDVPRQAFG